MNTFLLTLIIPFCSIFPPLGKTKTQQNNVTRAAQFEKKNDLVGLPFSRGIYFVSKTYSKYSKIILRLLLNHIKTTPLNHIKIRTILSHITIISQLISSITKTHLIKYKENFTSKN